ncbi:hypothetical protein JZM24_11970 [Candidatus Sodalis endolongispinus]|uniref:Uncharacterized protein n=1 Tax=Candidatus Sodalis endolongispinus TaxID=2812662 RepID=A0ABS5YDG5_9GAMM|nr:hypothetical protein [Candidatus Sodalis endolongispinus]MBT9432659.1 hypothetical protein [Candidatus Sodalis endolongispinus]
MHQPRRHHRIQSGEGSLHFAQQIRQLGGYLPLFGLCIRQPLVKTGAATLIKTLPVALLLAFLLTLLKPALFRLAAQ